jgi:glycosyltransferase involved in cell wall biosynthesis
MEGDRMRLVHLTSSIFYGGPERQMLGMADALPPGHDVTFVSFAEDGRCEPFLAEARNRGYAAIRLNYDTPRLLAAARELSAHLREIRPDVVLCHTYKANLVGRPVCRTVGVRVVAVSRAWTGEDFKVRMYDRLDRYLLKRFDRVVAVSEGQAEQVRATGVPERKLRVIRNSARVDAFAQPDPAGRADLEALVPTPGERIVVSAGRLSPDKGFDVLIRAAAVVCTVDPGARFVVFGDGVLREELPKQASAAGLSEKMAFAGFRTDLDRLMPHADVFVLPSFNEGLPNVILEASAAGVPVVATAVSGTPEAILDGQTGHLVAAGDAATMANRLLRLLGDVGIRRRMGRAGRTFVAGRFTFTAQAQSYLNLFSELLRKPRDAEIRILEESAA